MFISENGLNLIKEFEGCILSAYDDYNDRIVSDWSQVRGTITIGWGITPDDGINIYPGMSISQQEADDMFRNSMCKYCDCVNDAMGDGTISFPVNQNMFDALTSFCYNCGGGSLRSLCGGRDRDTVADKMLQYNKGNGQVLQGLVRRRQAERDLFLSDGEGGVVIQCGGGNSDPISHAREFVGEKCKELQEKLISLGYDCGGFGADGKFGQGTYNSLIQFQKDKNLQVDGLAGNEVFSTLDSLLNGNNQSQPAPQPASQPQEARYWVGRIQQLCNSYGMNIAVDNLWGFETENAVRNLPLAGIPYTTPEATRFIQERVGAGVDGIFLNESAEKVGEWQRNHGLVDDQIVGFNTYKSLACD